MKLKKWLIYKLTGKNMELIEEQLKHFRNEIEELREECRQLSEDNNCMYNKILFKETNAPINKEDIVILKHSLMVNDKVNLRERIAENFKQTILNEDLFDFEIINKIATGKILIIRPKKEN